MRRNGVVSVILAFVLLVPLGLAAQTQFTIQGTVQSEMTGQAVQGVQVQLRGTPFGSLTDENGRYQVRADVSAGTYELVFSFIGMSSTTVTVELAGTGLVTVPSVTLEESALELDEIVVTGTAGAASRRSVGNSVTSVAGEELATAPAVTIDQALQGRVPGALITSNTGTPGGGISVRLRGTSSITGGAEPLYIVDGVIIDNNASQQINVGYRSNPINRLADLDPSDIERIEIIKGAAAAALYGSRANNGVVQIFTKRGRAGQTNVTVSTRATRSDLENRIEFAMTPVDTDGNAVERFDPQDLVFRTGWGTDTHASVSGGSEDTRYYLSTGYSQQDGIMIGSAHEKLTTRLNLDQDFGNRFSVSAGASYITSVADLVISGEQGEGGLLTAIMFTPTTVNLAERNPETGELVVQATTFPNPLIVAEEWDLPQTVDRFVGSFQAQAVPVDALTLEYRLGFDNYSMETRQSIPRETDYGALETGRVVSANRANMLVNNDLVGNLQWGAGSSVDMTTSLGLNHTFQRVDQLNASASDITPLTRFVRGALQAASQSRTELVTLGAFGQQQIAWRDVLYLTGALRVDGSSTFGPDERWQLYPKLGASYVLSDEAFFQNSALGGFFDELRLRAAIGYAGNQPPLGLAYARANRFGTAINVDRLGLVPLSTAGNPELKPERQREIEAGLDLAVLNDRVGLSVTWYDQYTDDLLLPRLFAPSSGVGSIFDNVGALSNWGIEASLETLNLSSEDVRWSSTFIYSMNRNEVEELEGAPFFQGYTNRVEEGQPLGVHWMSAFERDEGGNIVLDEDGLPVIHRDADGNIEKLIVGNPWPSFTASLLNELDLGDSWSMSLLFDGQFGHELWNQGQRIMDIFGAGPLYDELLRDDITQAERSRKQSIWEYYLEDASFVKVREATLRYRLPSSLTSRIGAGSIQVEVMGRNLLTFTDYTGYDPEINMFGLSTVERGTDFAVYPNSRTLSIGIRANY